MADAKKMQMRVDFDATTNDGKKNNLPCKRFCYYLPGFLAAYDDIVTDENKDEESADKRLPAMTLGQTVKVDEYTCEGHETKPPARYTEPTLLRNFWKSQGIGRPSTFASIIQTIQDRGYVWRSGRALVPTFLQLSL